jgi:hypothetical protein
MRLTVTLCIMLCCVFFLVIAPRVSAQPLTADVGTKICRDVQLLAQAAAGEEEDWLRHGQRVSAASSVVHPLVESLVITEDCSGCIMRQFARRIAVADQEPCGPDRVCGDGEIDPGEECDDGPQGSAECTSDCTAIPITCPEFVSYEVYSACRTAFDDVQEQCAIWRNSNCVPGSGSIQVLSQTIDFENAFVAAEVIARCRCEPQTLPFTDVVGVDQRLYSERWLNQIEVEICTEIFGRDLCGLVQ